MQRVHGRTDRPENNYHCQNFKYFFRWVPKQVFMGVPKISNKFSREWTGVPVTQLIVQGNCTIWRSKYVKSDLLRERRRWYPSLVQDIVSFIGLVCKRDLWWAEKMIPVSCTGYSLFYRALLQKRPMIVYCKERKMSYRGEGYKTMPYRAENIVSFTGLFCKRDLWCCIVLQRRRTQDDTILKSTKQQNNNIFLFNMYTRIAEGYMTIWGGFGE